MQCLTFGGDEQIPRKFEYDVFLSHSHKDVSIVHPLAERLRGDGLKVWLDDWEIEPSDSIPQMIGDGLERSRVLLMLLSENFDKSDWTKYESGTFLFSDPQNKQQRFIPVQLDDAEVPFRIRHFARLEWQDRSEAAYQKMLSACRLDSSDTDRKSVRALSEKKELPTIINETSQTGDPGRAAFHPPVLKKIRSLGHAGSVNSVALTPDGSSVISGACDNTVRVWNLSSGECTATLEGHTGFVRSVALTPDGRSIVSGSDDGTVRVWDLSSGECTATLEGHSGYVMSVALTPDGTSVVSGSSDNAVRVWALSSGECTATLEGHSGYVMSLGRTDIHLAVCR